MSEFYEEIGRKPKKDPPVEEWIIERIARCGPQTNGELSRLRGADTYGLNKEVDAALQRLRKRGSIVPTKIVRDGKKVAAWALVEAKPCSRCAGTGKEPVAGGKST